MLSFMSASFKQGKVQYFHVIINGREIGWDMEDGTICGSEKETMSIKSALDDIVPKNISMIRADNNEIVVEDNDVHQVVYNHDGDIIRTLGQISIA